VDSSRVASERVAIWEAVEAFDPTSAGSAAYEKIKTLYPICRSITGDGIRQSLRSLAETIPLRIHEVPTGTQVFDWTVPNEWNIRDAYIKNSQGERVVDFKRHNLHVLNYSVPVRQRMPLAELRTHLFSAPDAPEWVPYRTSYYREAWGFCLSHTQLQAMPDGEYEVCIDSSLGPGSLSYGEYRIAGASEHEVLISCHSCHPSLCNDNLSGMTVAAELARVLERVALRYSYRFVWIPGTIGAITWLAQHEALLPNIRHGLVLSCVGDSGPFTYKRSRRGNADVDRAVEHVLKYEDGNTRIRDFIPYGYDERQYCSPGINLPVGCFMRTPNGEYPEYHSSADDLTLVSASSLGQSVERLLQIVQVLEENQRWMNLSPKCEPQLGRRGLYRQTGGLKSTGANEMAMLWVLNYSDGQHDLLDIATRAGIPFGQIANAARALQAAGLLTSVQE
jgi:aminopeptidase-like protein